MKGTKKSSLSSSQKALIAFIKTNKRDFYKSLFKWYGHRGLLLSLTNVHSSPVKGALSRFPDNYGYVAELNIIETAIRNGLGKAGATMGLGSDDLILLHNRYWDRFHNNYLFPKVKKKGISIPHMKKTEAVKEFLARGFVHQDDAVNWRDRKYIVRCTIAPLVWPQGFDSHSDACQCQTRVGIPGYTSAPIPK